MTDMIEVTFRFRRSGENDAVYTRPLPIHEAAWPDGGFTTPKQFGDALEGMVSRYLAEALKEYQALHAEARG